MSRADDRIDALKSRGVLLVTGCYAPVGAPGTVRMLRFARWLRAWGWRVQVLTLRPRSDVPIDPGLLEAAPPGVRVVSVPGLYPLAILSWLWRFVFGSRRSGRAATPGRPAAPTRAPGVVRDLVTTIFQTPDSDIGWLPVAALAIPRFAFRNRPAFIVSSGPPHTAHLVAAVIRPLLRARWLVDLRDPWARTAWASEKFVGPIAARVHAWQERIAVKRADGVILNTPQLRDEFAATYPDFTDKFSCIPNGFDDEAVPLTIEPLAGRRPIRLAHAGSLYGDRDPTPLLHAMANLVRQGRVAPGEIELLLVGWIDPRFDLPRLVGELGLGESVRLEAWMPRHEARALLDASDVLLLIQPKTGLQIPSKLFEYMRMGKPVLALVEPGAASDVVTRGRLGPHAPPEDVGRIESALMQLMDATLKVEPDWDYLAQFSGEALTRRLEERLIELARD